MCAAGALGGSASAVHVQAVAQGGPCGLRLPPPVRGETAFRVPSGGRAARRLLAGRLALCTLYRRDGSRFASLYSDAHLHVLGAAFYRPSGMLQSATDASYAATPGSEKGADVKCDSSSQASIGKTYWRDDEEMVDRRDGAGDEPGQGRPGCPERAERVDEQHQLVRHQGPGEPTGATTKARRLGPPSTTGTAPSTGAASRRIRTAARRSPARSSLRRKGNPVETDIRFSTAVKWSTNGASGAYDIQSVAAHEIGHVLQFDHVTNSSKRRPHRPHVALHGQRRYIRPQARPRRRTRKQQPLLIGGVPKVAPPGETPR